jgi:hypothetical protein
MHTFHDLFSGLKKEQFLQALLMLWSANVYAERTDVDFWEFAVEIRELHELGLSENDLRYLVRLKLIKHASELEDHSLNVRKFEPDSDLHFTSRSCFVLTTLGNEAASTLSRTPKVTTIRLKATVLPKWDAQHRTLIYQQRVVKHFRIHAANQETILAAFQEEGWPLRIDDPLVPLPELDAKRRLSDAIKFLNRNQITPVIRFRGDGTGQGVRWEVLIPKRMRAS